MSLVLAILIATFALIYVRYGVFDSVRRAYVAVSGICAGYAFISFAIGAPVISLGAISS